MAHRDRETGRPGDEAKRLIALFVLMASLSSCHHMKPDPRIRLEISPTILHSGTVVTGRAFVEGPVLGVRGRAEVLGSPSYIMKKDEACGCWLLKGQVPYGQRMRPGRYRLRVEARYEDGSRGRAWAEVEVR